MICKRCELETGHWAQHADADRCLDALKACVAKQRKTIFGLGRMLDVQPHFNKYENPYRHKQYECP